MVSAASDAGAKNTPHRGVERSRIVSGQYGISFSVNWRGRGERAIRIPRWANVSVRAIIVANVKRETRFYCIQDAGLVGNITGATLLR